MAFAQWKGFLPDGAVVMARRVAAPVAAPFVESVAELQPQSVPAPPATEASTARVLLFLESQPDPQAKELIAKMMAAIQLAPGDYTLEWGDFPKASSPFVLGLGLTSRKSARLSALRPEWVELPSPAEIAAQPARKREAWEKLQRLQAQMRL